MTGDGAVLLLAPVVNEYDALTSIGRAAQALQLRDLGASVEWCDGDQTQRWTLPDQPAQEGTPVLTSVVEADTWFRSLRGDAPERYVLLADESGNALVVLALITTAAGPTYEQVDFDRMWPEAQFDALSARGVPRVRATYRDLRALEKAHPGAVARWRLLVGSRASYWLQAGALAAAAVAIGARILLG